jgi:hypothetical protein
MRRLLQLMLCSSIKFYCLVKVKGYIVNFMKITLDYESAFVRVLFSSIFDSLFILLALVNINRAILNAVTYFTLIHCQH